MADTPIGNTLDAHGVTLDLEPDDFIEGVLILAKVHRGATGRRTVMIGGSRDIDWYDQFALIKLGNHLIAHDDD